MMSCDLMLQSETVATPFTGAFTLTELTSSERVSDGQVQAPPEGPEAYSRLNAF